MVPAPKSRAQVVPTGLSRAASGPVTSSQHLAPGRWDQLVSPRYGNVGRSAPALAWYARIIKYTLCISAGREAKAKPRTAAPYADADDPRFAGRASSHGTVRKVCLHVADLTQHGTS